MKRREFVQWGMAIGADPIARRSPEVRKRLADIAKKGKHKEATYVFTNVDMFADAKRFKKAMKL